jgi:DNA-binding NtrC family response regulator
MWERKRKRYSKPDQEYYSVSNKLKSDGKITGDFEVMLSSLTMEEIIALRLELAARSIGGKLYGLKLWESLPRIAKAAALKYSYSAARTKNEAAAFLGISKNEFRKLLKQYNITNYFSKEEIL